MITLTEDLALEQAAQADKEIARGNIADRCTGFRSARRTCSTPRVSDHLGSRTVQGSGADLQRDCIDRLEKAGAVLVAKLSMGALAQGDVWFAGMTKNPWNLEQGSSGSSAGSASATAAGMVGFSIGTETLGSIVSPSTRCGVTGLRPTYGRVSRYGAMGLSWTMDKIGPICRSVEDCALVLNAMYGPDGHDVTTIDAPLDWNPAAPLSNLKIGYLKGEFERTQGFGGRGGNNPNAAQQAAARKKIYEDASRSAAQGRGEAGRGGAAADQRTAACGSSGRRSRGGVRRHHARWPRRATARAGSQDWPNSFRTSRLIPAVEYIRAQRARTLLQQQMDEFMQKWDVLVTPTGSATLTITNLTGHPQVAVPCGFINGNSPQSIMFTGRLYEEGTPLRVAHAFEQSTEWHNMHPKMEWAG